MRNLRSHIGVLIPVLFFIILLIIFSVQRVTIRLLLPQPFADSSLSHTLTAMLIGLRFDINIAATLACPMITLILAGPLFKKTGFQKFLSIFCTAILLILIFGCVADFYFFKQFSERLNHKALVYLDADYLYRIIWNDYPIISLAVVFCLLALILYKVISGFIAAHTKHIAVPALSIAETLFSIAFMVLLAFFAIRGTFGPKAINTGPAYFCSSSSIAQLTLNGFFTLREAAVALETREVKINKLYKLMSPQRASKNTAALIAGPNDRFLNSGFNPLLRTTDYGNERHDYNVVLVVLESLSWQYIGKMGAKKSYTPNFDRLISEGLFMDSCFAVGDRTTRGFGAIVSSYPDLPGKSVTTRPQAEGKFLTLGSILKSRGYETMFIYGGQPLYDHRQAFLASNGYSHMVFYNDFISRSFKAGLGYCDEDLYNQADMEFKRCKDKPFFATLLSLSFHPSYKIPPGKIEAEPVSTNFHEQIDAIRYTDWAIGKFIERASNSSYFKNTIFVFVADHMGGFKQTPITAASYRIPFLIYAPGIVKPARISSICSQLDVAPTIMHLMGGSYEHCFFGSSVLGRQANSGFAWILNYEQLIYINSARKGIVISPGNHYSYFIFMPPDKLKPLGSKPGGRLSEMPVSILQVAATLFENGNYNLDASTTLAMNHPPLFSGTQKQEMTKKQ